MKPKTDLRIVVSNSHDEPFLIMSIQEAIAREVCDFMDLVPAKDEALHLLMDSIDKGALMHDARLRKLALLELHASGSATG